MLVREATAADLPGILEIHNDAIAHSTALWMDELADLSERERWLDEHGRAGYPVLVAAEGSRVLGYASLSTWRTRSGYRHSVEDSVYVREGAQGAGVGRALLTRLIDLARERGYHVVIADIEAMNEASIRLHASLGFEICGTIREVGTKFDRWLDLTIMRLALD